MQRREGQEAEWLPKVATVVAVGMEGQRRTREAFQRKNLELVSDRPRALELEKAWEMGRPVRQEAKACMVSSARQCSTHHTKTGAGVPSATYSLMQALMYASDTLPRKLAVSSTKF